MQQHRSSGWALSSSSMWGPATSAGEQNVNEFRENHEETVNNDAIERAGGSREHAADIPPVDVESVPRLGRANCATSTPTGQAGHPQFRTEVPVGALTVTGVLPCSARALAGSITIAGDVRFLSCDEALELVDALLLVVARMDVVVEQYSTTMDATRDRRD
jgi:hypothetical protein